MNPRAIVRLEELGKLGKKPISSLEIEPTTFYCYIARWPTSTSQKRLSLEKVITWLIPTLASQNSKMVREIQTYR
jgi:hypothetical protein